MALLYIKIASSYRHRLYSEFPKKYKNYLPFLL